MNVSRKNNCKRIAYAGNRIRNIKKNSLVVNKLQVIFQKGTDDKFNVEHNRQKLSELEGEFSGEKQLGYLPIVWGEGIEDEVKELADAVVRSQTRHQIARRTGLGASGGGSLTRGPRGGKVRLK